MSTPVSEEPAAGEITIETASQLFVNTLSKRAATLTTVDGFGIEQTASGTYSCIAVNDINTTRTESIEINVQGAKILPIQNLMI